jgi:sodium transport system ATP-binding protein
VIEIRDLRKAFGAVQAVDGVTFSAEDGRVTGLLGPNGAGKTTTLRILYGLIAADAGIASVDGVDSTRDPDGVRRRLGVLPDDRGLYPRLTAREHMRYFGGLHGLGGQDLERRIDELIDVLDMGTIANRPTAGFSQGERVKVAIGRALVHGPSHVVLDEPTNGLDVMAARAMRELIGRLRDEGKCVLFSSHVMQEVAALCDHIVVIAAGRVVAEGTPDELIESTGSKSLEDAFIVAVGSAEGLVQ